MAIIMERIKLATGKTQPQHVLWTRPRNLFPIHMPIHHPHLPETNLSPLEVSSTITTHLDMLANKSNTINSLTQSQILLWTDKWIHLNNIVASRNSGNQVFLSVMWPIAGILINVMKTFEVMTMRKRTLIGIFVGIYTTLMNSHRMDLEIWIGARVIANHHKSKIIVTMTEDPVVMDPMVAITAIMEAIVAAPLEIISDKIVMAAIREITAATATVEIIIDSLNHLLTLPINK